MWRTVDSQLTVCIISAHDVLFLSSLWTHDPCGPLRPVIVLHLSRSFAMWTASGSVQLHQSAMSSDHLLVGLPRGRLPSVIPSVTSFTRRWFRILHMCPNSCSFLCLITSMMVWHLLTLKCLCQFWSSGSGSELKSHKSDWSSEPNISPRCGTAFDKRDSRYTTNLGRTFCMEQSPTFEKLRTLRDSNDNLELVSKGVRRLVDFSDLDLHLPLCFHSFVKRWSFLCKCFTVNYELWTINVQGQRSQVKIRA